MTEEAALESDGEPKPTPTPTLKAGGRLPFGVCRCTVEPALDL
ncbi:hypothetical protein ACFVDH_21180 [Streptomyces sp. NPDC057674]